MTREQIADQIMARIRQAMKDKRYHLAGNLISASVVGAMWTWRFSC